MVVQMSVKGLAQGPDRGSLVGFELKRYDLTQYLNQFYSF